MDNKPVSLVDYLGQILKTKFYESLKGDNPFRWMSTQTEKKISEELDKIMGNPEENIVVPFRSKSESWSLLSNYLLVIFHKKLEMQFEIYVDRSFIKFSYVNGGSISIGMGDTEWSI